MMKVNKSVQNKGINNQDSLNWWLNLDNFSSWENLKRTNAWVMRFVNNCRRADKSKTIRKLEDNEVHLIRQAQIECFTDYNDILKEKSLFKGSKLLPLNPFIDTDELLR